MSAILSREVPAFDVSATGFRAAAGDLGEVIALMAGGVRPDPEALSRLTPPRVLALIDGRDSAPHHPHVPRRWAGNLLR